MFYKSQYVSHQTECSTEFFLVELWKKTHIVNPGDNYNNCASTSRELDFSNVSHFFTHLRKCQPLKKVLTINNYDLSVRFQRKFLWIWFKHTHFGGLKIRLCHPPALSAAKITQNLGMNIYAVLVSHFTSYVHQFVEKLFSLTAQIFLAVSHQVNIFYEWNGGWHWKVHIYGVYFWLALTNYWMANFYLISS